MNYPGLFMIIIASVKNSTMNSMIGPILRPSGSMTGGYFLFWRTLIRFKWRVKFGVVRDSWYPLSVIRQVFVKIGPKLVFTLVNSR